MQVSECKSDAQRSSSQRRTVRSSEQKSGGQQPRARKSRQSIRCEQRLAESSRACQATPCHCSGQAASASTKGKKNSTRLDWSRERARSAGLRNGRESFARSLLESNSFFCFLRPAKAINSGEFASEARRASASPLQHTTELNSEGPNSTHDNHALPSGMVASSC